MANVQVRGCCCGIPFGCGVLAVVLLAVGLWKLIPGHLWHFDVGLLSSTPAVLVVPGVVGGVPADPGGERLSGPGIVRHTGRAAEPAGEKLPTSFAVERQEGELAKGAAWPPVADGVAGDVAETEWNATTRISGR